MWQAPSYQTRKTWIVDDEYLTEFYGNAEQNIIDGCNGIMGNLLYLCNVCYWLQFILFHSGSKLHGVWKKGI